MKNKKVLILGVTGLVGEACALKFIQEEYIVYGIARNQPKPDATQPERFNFISMDLVTEQVKLCELIKELSPNSIVIATGNHSKRYNQLSSTELFRLHFDLVNNIYFSLQRINLKNHCTVIFCSSIMAYIPDRIFPAYSAAKAGLNQYLISMGTKPSSQVNFSGIVLGPVHYTNNSIFSVSPKKVAERIFMVSQKNSNSLHFFPIYGRFLAFMAFLFPNFIESVIFKFRKVQQ